MRNVPGEPTARRSDEWFERRDLDGFLHRSWLNSTGVTDEIFRGLPVIGMCLRGRTPVVDDAVTYL